MSAQHRSKRRKLGDESDATNAQYADPSNESVTTPTKPTAKPEANTIYSNEQLVTSVPLSRTLGLFKKYHKQSPSTSQASSPSSARKVQPIAADASPSERLDTGSARKTVLSSPSRHGALDNIARHIAGTPTKNRSTKPVSNLRTTSHSNASVMRSRRNDSAVVIEDQDILAPADTPLKGYKSKSSVQAEDSDGDEIVVRSSHRKRTITEKLRAARGDGTVSSSPTDHGDNTKPFERNQGHDRQVHALHTPPNKRASKTLPGKENVAPDIVSQLSPTTPDMTASIVKRKLDRAAVVHNTKALSQSELALVKNAVLAQLCGTDPITLMGLDEQHSRVSTLIEQTIASGEGNSMLVIGPRGSGKSTLINQIIEEQRTKRANDFHVVRLTGFIHTDDKLALREIWRQLGREMEVDNTTHSYADTMSMLLALLSHPLENGQVPEAGTAAKSVIFILDEFDLFATHPRQTLLYNLFDIAQSRKAPIAVLGVTTRVDTVEQLEKRVKSRFSHRYVHMSLSKTFDVYESLCKHTLTINKAASTWNSTVETLFSLEEFQTHLKKLFYRSRSVSDFMAALLVPISTLTPSKTSAILEHILAHMPTAPASKLTNLPALSSMGTALLVCAARQSIYSIVNISFDVVYEEYKTIAAKMKLQAAASGALSTNRVWAREVAKLAWLELSEMGYVIDGRVDVSLEELAACGADIGPWYRWCREI